MVESTMMPAHIGLRLLLIMACSAGTAPLSTSAPAFAEEASAPSAEPVTEQASGQSSVNPDEINPSITLKGSVWRTKPGIVFLKTPVGLLTLSSKTTLKDLRGSQEVSFRVHGSS